jgi:hypothetical protein
MRLAIQSVRNQTMKIDTRTINVTLLWLLLGGIAIAAPTPTGKPTIRDPKEARMEMALYPESQYSICGSGAATVERPVSLLNASGSLTVPIPPALQAKDARVAALCQDAEAQIKKGDLAVAASDYHQAVILDPLYRNNIYSEAECEASLGDIDSAIGTYRQAVYTDGGDADATTPEGGCRETDVSRLMEYALVLNRAGDAQEAVSVYNHAATLLDFDPRQKGYEPVLLPQFGSETGQEDYTPQRLTAMADLATAVPRSCTETDTPARSRSRRSGPWSRSRPTRRPRTSTWAATSGASLTPARTPNSSRPQAWETTKQKQR